MTQQFSLLVATCYIRTWNEHVLVYEILTIIWRGAWEYQLFELNQKSSQLQILAGT